MMRKHGELVPVSWEECLDDLSARLRKTIDTHGPNAIGVYQGGGLGLDAAGRHMAQVFYDGLGSPPKFTPITIDSTAKILISSTMGGYPGFLGHTDYDNVGMMLYVGTNPMVSHGHITRSFNPAVNIRAVARRGEVWTLDPLRTETAKFSTRHIQPWPGKDYAILAWLVREVLDGGPINLAQPVEGMDELRALLDDYDLATAAAIAGVPQDDLTSLLAAIRRTGHVVIETGTGTGMSSGMNMTQWLAWVLMILTGRMNRKGGLWFHPGFVRQMDQAPLPVVFNPLSPGPASRPELPCIIGDTPCAALPDEIFAGHIRSVMNFSGGLVRALPDVNVLTKALKSLDVLATFEITANDTTALSTHVLPTKDQLERPDLTMGDVLSTRLSMQYTPASIAPLGERRSGWWVISQINRRLGLPVPDYTPLEDSDPELDNFMLSKMLDGARCTFEEVAATGYVEREAEFPARWVDEHIDQIGGWKLAPPMLVDQWQQKLAEDMAQLGKPRPLSYISRRQRRKLNSGMDCMGETADIILHPDDAAEHDIAEGQMVRVHNSRGEITLVARLDEGMRRGVTSIPHGHGNANVNYLTSVESVDPLGGMVHYSGVPIEVEPVAA
jgi:anaerobic selenocysteine-containing dehydrogenase